ncbi:MAG TPA: hypothetical protein VLL69_19405, partial [Streptosporangiaceae bacterium]|nr:hypothetical protein [Streptosporangiaceae bacterium]
MRSSSSRHIASGQNDAPSACRPAASAGGSSRGQGANYNPAEDTSDEGTYLSHDDPGDLYDGLPDI